MVIGRAYPGSTALGVPGQALVEAVTVPPTVVDAQLSVPSTDRLEPLGTVTRCLVVTLPDATGDAPDPTVTPSAVVGGSVRTASDGNAPPPGSVAVAPLLARLVHRTVTAGAFTSPGGREKQSALNGALPIAVLRRMELMVASMAASAAYCRSVVLCTESAVRKPVSAKVRTAATARPNRLRKASAMINTLPSSPDGRRGRLDDVMTPSGDRSPRRRTHPPRWR